MAAESVKIVLEGVDKASPAFTSVAARIKETGDQSQKLGGVFSKIFDSLGLDQLSMASNQFGGLAGQMKELGEAGTKGGAGMIAAKAGIVAASVAASYSVGTMIADWIYQTEEWRAGLLETLQAAEKQAAKLNAKRREQFDLEMQIAELAATPEERIAEQQAILGKVNSSLEEQKKKAAEAKKELAALRKQWGSADAVKAAEKQLEIEQQRLDLLREQKAEAEKAIRGPTDREQLLEDRKAAAKEREAAEAERKRAEKAAYDEFRKSIEDTMRAMEQQEQRDKAYLENLKAQNIELTQGKRAADEYRAALAGISEETIAAGRELQIQNDLLAAQAELEAERKRQDKETQAKLAAPPPILQAVQSRLLTRASVNPQQDRAVKANEKTAELTAKIEQLQREQQALLSDIRSNTDNQLMVVGEP